MKKINAKTIIILAIVLALTVSLVTSVSASYTIQVSMTTVGYSTDDGYVTNDSLVYSDTTKTVHVGDLFLTGGIGTAESTGVLTAPGYSYDEQAHWTLKDGVLVIDGPINSFITTGVSSASPFWNNPYIETIVIGENVTKIDGVSDGALFYFGLPNLKNVIFLGDTKFEPCRSYATPLTLEKDGTIGPFGDFPTDHEIKYLWTYVNAVGTKGMTYAKGKSGVGTSNDTAHFNTENDTNTFFEQSERSAFLTAAAPVIANTKLNQMAIDLMPDDMIAAVNAIGGFNNLVGGTDGTKTPYVEPEPEPEPERTFGGITVTFNGAAVAWTDAEPFIDENSRTMVPLRAVGDAMGLTVTWHADLQKAGFGRDNYGYITFSIGNNEAFTYKYADNEAGAIWNYPQMDTVPVIVNDRTYAPIRYLAEFFGYSVAWDAATKTVSITG